MTAPHSSATHELCCQRRSFNATGNRRQKDIHETTNVQPINMHPVAVVLIVLSIFLSSVNGRRDGLAERKPDRIRNRDRQNLRKDIYVDNLENVCDVQTPVSVYCYCDSLTLQDATTADCWIFNVTVDNDLIWHSFSTQTHLQELRFKLRPDGRLHFIPRIVLQNLSNLTQFEISYAEIGTIASDIFHGLVALEKLTLKRNKIEKINRTAFRGLENLHSLVLSENLIGQIERGVFDGLVALNVLQLDHNNISLIGDDSFTSLNLLSELDLSNNNIAVLTPETLMGLQSLQYLYLQNNIIEVIGDNTFIHTSQLLHLNLRGNQIKMIHSDGFRNLKYLNYLNLQDNHLTQLGIPMWAGLSNLRDLNLKNNKIEVLNQTAFTLMWNNLVNESMIFSLEGNPLKCDCNWLWLVHLNSVTQSSSIKRAIQHLSCLQNDAELIKLIEVLPSLHCVHFTSEAGKEAIEASLSTIASANSISATPIPFSMTSWLLPTTQPFLYMDEQQTNSESSNKSTVFTHPTTEPENAKIVTRQVDSSSAIKVTSPVVVHLKINSSKQVDQSSGVRNNRLSVLIALSVTFAFTFLA